MFNSRSGKPPDPKPHTAGSTQLKPSPAVPVSINSTFEISRPTLTRSKTYDKDGPSFSTQTVDIGNNLTQNVINKLQEETFTTTSTLKTSNVIRMSISPIAPSEPTSFAVPRQVKNRNVPAHINSTPFRSSPAIFSTKLSCDSKPLPPISFDITGTDPVTVAHTTENFSPTIFAADNIADISEPSFLPVANLSPFDSSASSSTFNKSNNQFTSIMAHASDYIADITAPSFLAQCTPMTQCNTDAEGKLIVDTTSSLSATGMNEMTTPKSSRTNNTQDDESTLKSTTMLLCLGDDSRHEDTLVPLVPDNGDGMEIDDRGSTVSCGKYRKTLELSESQRVTFYHFPFSSVDVNASSTTPIDMPNKQRFSFGQDITEWTLDCSIELYDSSVGSSAPNASSPSHMKKQNSFDEKSLSILTPDQMKEFLDSNNANLNLDLPLFPKMQMLQCRIDQTPSPEELPLDPIGVKTDTPDMQSINDNQSTNGQYAHEHQLSQTDSYSKTDQMTKSAASKVSNSFITSVTSITSLDNGYQGDGEMSRPASRGGDHSPSNMPRIHEMRPIAGREPLLVNNNQNNIAIVRRQDRQDPMTDSDFFTESDADDMVNRGDRRAQVIDGQLYGAPMVQEANINHYVNQQPSTEDSCMESSGIFTDVENRADDDLIHRSGLDSDMSPDGSTDTIKSSNMEYNNRKNSTVIHVIAAETDTCANNNNNNNQQGHSLSDSTSTSTINSSCEKGGDRQSVISEFILYLLFGSFDAISVVTICCGW